jgi:hypothetical protein
VSSLLRRGPHRSLHLAHLDSDIVPHCAGVCLTVPVRAENISYGFRRNLLGLKRPAVLLIALCVVANVCIRDFQVDPTRFWAGSLVCLALLVAGLVWLTVIQLAFVEDAGRTYALRLLVSSMRCAAKQDIAEDSEITHAYGDSPLHDSMNIKDVGSSAVSIFDSRFMLMA